MDMVDHLRHVVLPHAQRFIDGHFGNDAPRPQISIPASEREDSDLIVSRGIKNAADEIERLRKKVADMQSDFQRIADCAQQQCPSDGTKL